MPKLAGAMLTTPRGGSLLAAVERGVCADAVGGVAYRTLQDALAAELLQGHLAGGLPAPQSPAL